MPTLTNRGHVRWGLALQTAGAGNKEIGQATSAESTATVPLYASNDPAISSGASLMETDHLDGDGRYASDRFKIGTRAPGCSGLEIPFNSYCTPHILATLFQYGSDTTGKKEFVSRATPLNPIYTTDYQAYPVTNYNTPCAVTLMRGFTQANAEDQYLYGAVAKSVTISGDSTGFLKMSVDFLAFGYGWAQSLTMATANGSTYGLVHPFCNFGGDANNIKLGGSAVNTRSFSITIDNGATVRHWNAAYPTAIAFARRMSVTGELNIVCDPADAAYPGLQAVLAAFIAPSSANEKTLTITQSNDSATPDAAGEWQILANIIASAEPETVDTDNVYDIRIPFRSVYTSAGAPDIKIIAHNGVTGWTS